MMSKVTLVLKDTQYTIDRELIIKHSQFLKDLLEAYPDEKGINLTFPIKSINKFVDYMNGKTISFDYDEFTIHMYLDTKTYFDHLIYLMVEEGIDIKKIESLDANVSWEIYNHLPLNMVPKEMLTESFLERYKTKRLPNYPENVRVTRNEREVKTEVLISADYCKDGRYLSWYPNGQIKEQSNWSKGKEDGFYQSWYQNGQIMWQSNWSQGELTNGCLFEFWHENGNKCEESNWLEGKKHGLRETWHENGQRKEISNWLDGKVHGLYQTWYENGQRREISNWLDGKKHALRQLWYENGQRREISNWLRGNKHGSYQSWHPDGRRF